MISGMVDAIYSTGIRTFEKPVLLQGRFYAKWKYTVFETNRTVRLAMYRVISMMIFLCIACLRLQADVPYKLWVTAKGDDPTPVVSPLVVQPDGILELTLWYSAPDVDPDPDHSYGLLGLEVCLGWDTTRQIGPSAAALQKQLVLDGTLTEAVKYYLTGPGGDAICGFQVESGAASDSVRPFGLQYSHASIQGFPASSAQKLLDIRLRNHSLLPGQSQQIVIWDAGKGISYTSYMTPQEGQTIRLGTQSITVLCAATECSITGKVHPGVRGMGGKLQLLAEGSNVPVDEIDVTPDDTGLFSVKTSRTGTYTLRFVWPNHLPRAIPSVEITSETQLPVEVVLTNGDANRDGQINLFDFVELDANFGSTTSSADLNGDGFINLFDYVIIDENFGALS